MSRILTIILMLLTGFMGAYVVTSYAAVTLPSGSDTSIASSSMVIGQGGGNSVTSAKDFGFRILGVIRVIVSGVALIYLVMIGAYIILGSDKEETVKTQRKQITYALIGFLFLNIPGFVYTIFAPSSSGSIAPIDDWSRTTTSSVFWNTAGFEGIIGNMIAFLRVFVFGAAVTMFTWGLFNLLVSGGDDEKKKKAKNRIIYGIVGLVFIGFAQLWGNMVAAGDLTSYIPSVGSTLFALVMYIAAPISIFMIIWGAYLFITSAGDEERVKKGKSILINTGIALIILLAGLSFMTDIVTFQL